MLQKLAKETYDLDNKTGKMQAKHPFTRYDAAK